MPKMPELRLLTRRPAPPPAIEPTTRHRAGCADYSDPSVNNDYTTHNELETYMTCTDCPNAADCSGIDCNPVEPELVKCYNCADCDGSCKCNGSGPCGDPNDSPVATVAVVVALGENEVAVPCLTFATVAEAVTFMTDRLGLTNHLGQWAIHDYDGMRDYVKDFFHDYHDDCGSINAFVVREVQHGQPIVSFDLD
jgi:hypothetical protein